MYVYIKIFTAFIVPNRDELFQKKRKKIKRRGGEGVYVVIGIGSIHSGL